MNPIFNTKNMFYDYFTHLPSARMKNDFGLGFYERSVIRNETQKAIRQAYDRLTNAHDLVHVNVYGEIGEEFDENFYNELKTTLHHHFHDHRNWLFLDDLIRQPELDDETEEETEEEIEEKRSSFNSRMQAALGYGLKRDANGNIDLKEAFIALFNSDLDVLTGRELLYLTKLK